MKQDLRSIPGDGSGEISEDALQRHLDGPQRWRTPLLLFVLGVVALLPSIWSETSVTGSDEYTLSLRTPMEMLEKNDWLTPWLDHEPRLRKPPLVYWAILSAYKTFGVDLVCARIWGVLAGAAMSVCACLFARELSRSNGLLAGLITLGAVGVAVESRRAMLDLPLALFVALAVLHWVRWLRREKLGNALLSAMWLGLSFLVKGPVGVFFFLTGAISALWAFQAWRVPMRRAGHLVMWLALVAAISLPWPLLMKHLWADQLAQIMGEEMAARHFGEWHRMAPFSALGGSLGLVLPWTPAFIGAVAVYFRSIRAERSRETAWLISWFLFSTLPFFFMQAFERYMLAVLPIQAVLTAAWLEGAPTRGKAIALRIVAVLLLVVAVIFGGFFVWFRLAYFWPLLAVALAAWVLWRTFRSSEPLAPALGTIAVLSICLGAAYPSLGINALPPEVAPATMGGDVVRSFKVRLPAMLSMRMDYSVQVFEPAPKDAPMSAPEVVFVEEFQQQNFEKMLKKAKVQAQELGRFRTFYSRRAWLRFAREDAGWPEWKAALQARSLEPLKVEFRYYRVSRTPA